MSTIAKKVNVNEPVPHRVLAPESAISEVPVTAAPTIDAIRQRAYEIYERRSREGRAGNAHSDWLAAEAELSRKA